MFWAIHTYAVRADNTNVSPSRFLKHLFLQPAPLLCVHLAESGSEEMDSFDVFGSAVIEELQRGLPRNGHDNVIYISWDHPEAGEDLEVTDSNLLEAFRLRSPIASCWSAFRLQG